jgi:hypothetical protein
MDQQTTPLIEGLFRELRALGAATSTDDFSENWLGMNKSYLRCLRARNRNPSPRALVQCATRLRKASGSMLASEQGPAFKKVAKRMGQLADVCSKELFSMSEF